MGLMRTLSIDIETYSSYDLAACGVYKYVEAPDFDILMIAVRDSNSPEEMVRVIDLLDHDDFMTYHDVIKDLLIDPNVIKTAWNANFERTCLSKYFGLYMPPEQWRCTMTWAAQLGLPLSLDACSKVLGVAQKDSLGKSLIRYFCQPCKPTAANGGRTRNYPHHNPEKWQQFIDYCRQDVVVERQIEDKARFFPYQEPNVWHLDQRINDRGVRVDEELVRRAMNMDAGVRERLIQEATTLTGLSNVNSAAQVKKWLSTATGLEVESLNKEAMPALLKAASGPAKRMLEIRQQLSKSSIAKYAAMAEAVCSDGRVRGIHQYYGANRTGRFAGRIIQPQNLPGQSLKEEYELDLARELVLDSDETMIEALFDSVPDVLSQLIRTAIIPEDGKVLIVSDFSAIEARVIAWLANEKWRLDFFNEGGDIYIASVSRMFNIPIKEVDKKLRQRGKVAELACGFQGGVSALIAMGALKMGLPEYELEPIVDNWRRANPNIVQLWYKAQKAAIAAVRTERPQRVEGCSVVYQYKYGHLFCKLPSGRMLTYWQARLVPGNYGDQIQYMGMDQMTKQWTKQYTYGGKLVENMVQAIARDLLVYKMLVLDEMGFDIIMHVHDEIVMEGQPGELSMVNDVMSTEVPWAKGLPLGSAGYEGTFYKKD
jgi:DNA polymerase bacteriophage-type